MNAQEAADRAAFALFSKWDIPRPPTKEIILAEFAPLLTAKDAEIDRLKGDLRHCAESAGTLDSCAAIAIENAKLRGLLGERDRLAAEVALLRRELTSR